jgi:dTDP-4-amino-4,6-dideoxygalactose transaminase
MAMMDPMAGQFTVGRYDYASQLAGEEQRLLADISALLQGGGYVLGSAVAEFENSFRRFLDYDGDVIGVNSGTDALILALDGLGVEHGDEVITVANTFHATALAITRVGARPILVDCDPETFLIDVPAVRASVGARTKAILPVHLYGQAADCAELFKVANDHDLLLIEDCAQAIGAYSSEGQIGTIGDAGCFSFVPSKNLAAAGDAGAIVIRDGGVAERIRMLRSFGQSEQNVHEVRGYNSRLDSIQALVLLRKLPYLDEWNKARMSIAGYYREALADLPIRFQQHAGRGEHVYHLFQIRARNGTERDELLHFLLEAGIDAVVRYPVPIHLQPAFRDLGYRRGQFPNAEALSAETLCLPLYPSLDEKSMQYVCGQVRLYYADR